ncbi:MAG: DUF3100 domain-containing protein [Methanosphaera sp.]|nr:DUF3100 domain-containing protein [Methanosphaera sp.]
MEKTNNDNNIRSVLNYKLHLTLLICIIVSEYIGTITLSFNGTNIILLPLIYSLILAIALYQSRHITWINEEESILSNKFMLLLVGPLIAKLSISSGNNIGILLNIGPALVLEQFGELCSIFIALPIALLLGFKRESIGMTSSICREPQMAIIIDKYGFNSKEVNGFMSVYIIGTVIGTIFISIIVNVLCNILPLHPYSYAMGCGIGSTCMNVAGLSSLIALYPDLSEQLSAFSGISNLICLIFSVYIYLFISLPLTERIYGKLEPVITKIFK